MSETILLTSENHNQTTIIPSTQLETILYDSGGPSGNYSNNENYNHTLSFTNGDTMVLNLNTESGYDKLTIRENNSSGDFIINNVSGTRNETIDISNLTGLYFSFYSDSFITEPGIVATITLKPVLLGNVCFVSGTSVKTDQGNIDINLLDKEMHTIRGNNIICITETISNTDSLLCIEKNALFSNVPSENTIITKNHKVMYKGQMYCAKNLISDNIHEIPYNNQKLYNVVLEKHDFMIVNNMIVETLDPMNLTAQIFESLKNKNSIEKENLITEYNNKILEHKVY